MQKRGRWVSKGTEYQFKTKGKESRGEERRREGREGEGGGRGGEGRRKVILNK